MQETPVGLGGHVGLAYLVAFTLAIVLVIWQSCRRAMSRTSSSRGWRRHRR